MTARAEDLDDLRYVAVYRGEEFDFEYSSPRGLILLFGATGRVRA